MYKADLSRLPQAILVRSGYQDLEKVTPLGFNLRLGRFCTPLFPLPVHSIFTIQSPSAYNSNSRSIGMREPRNLEIVSHSVDSDRFFTAYD